MGLLCIIFHCVSICYTIISRDIRHFLRLQIRNLCFMSIEDVVSEHQFLQLSTTSNVLILKSLADTCHCQKRKEKRRIR